MSNISPEIWYAAVNARSALNEVLPRTVPPSERISVVELENRDDGRIIEPITGREIRSFFNFTDPEQAKVSRLNLLMLDEVKNDNGVGLWLSPPKRVNETGKILVAARAGRKTIMYDLTDLTFSGGEFASFMTSLASYAKGGYFFVDDMMALGILEGIIPMPEVWEAIKTDRAKEKFNQDVRETAQKMIEDQGTGIRTRLHKDYGVDIALACPPGEDSNPIMKLISPDGKISEMHYVHNCGQCGAKIERYIKKGDRCRDVARYRNVGQGCDGVYEGC